jgi:NCS1 family nucleobase:cation symporter-1
LIALLIGILPNIPGFLAQIGMLDPTQMTFMVSLYDYAWFIGFAISGVVYYLLMRGQPR